MKATVLMEVSNVGKRTKYEKRTYKSNEVTISTLKPVDNLIVSGTLEVEETLQYGALYHVTIDTDTKQEVVAKGALTNA